LGVPAKILGAPSSFLNQITKNTFSLPMFSNLGNKTMFRAVEVVLIQMHTCIFNINLALQVQDFLILIYKAQIYEN